jgi:hypothetical protein
MAIVSSIKSDYASDSAISTIIEFLDIFHFPIFVSNDVSETGLRLLPQVKTSTQLGPMDIASPYRRTLSLSNDPT